MADLRQEKPGLVAGQIPWRFSFPVEYAGSPVSAGFGTCTFRFIPASRDAVCHVHKTTIEWMRLCRRCDCKVAPSCVGNIGKTKALEFAFGFAPSDALEVIRQLYGLIVDNPPAYKDKGPC